MTVSVPGIYREGKIELLETPKGLSEGPVQVVLIGQNSKKRALKYLPYGKYSGGRMSTLEDFKDAEWHGEEEFEEFRE